jgi:hypothetical protein
MLSKTKQNFKINVLVGFVILLATSITAVNAQKKGKLEYSGFFDSYYYRGPMSYTLSGGISGYSGDLCGGLGCQTLNYNFGAGFQYKVWPRTSFGAEFNYFTLGATDAVANRNISFTATNYELVITGRLYLIDDVVRVAADRGRKYKKIKPYITLGAGGLLYTPVSTYYAPPVDSIFRSEGRAYPNITAVFPAGFGVQYVITPRVSVLGELSYRLSISDYLDDVGIVRGNNAGLKDSYGFFNIKLQITPSAPAKKKKKTLPVPESTGIGGGSGGTTAPATTPTAAPDSTATPPAQDSGLPETPANGGTEEKPADAPSQDLQNLQPAEKKEETK